MKYQPVICLAFFVLALMLSCTAAATPTPDPTYTPYPTPVPLATHTPFPTWTPVPTADTPFNSNSIAYIYAVPNLDCESANGHAQAMRRTSVSL